MRAVHLQVPFGSFYKSFCHQSEVESDGESGADDCHQVAVADSPTCPVCVDAYLELCRKYNTEANPGVESKPNIRNTCNAYVNYSAFLSTSTCNPHKNARTHTISKVCWCSCVSARAP